MNPFYRKKASVTKLIEPAAGINLKDYPNSILSGKLWRVTQKIDGVRRLFYKDKIGNVTCFSRTNKPDIYLSHICGMLSPPWFPGNTMYDCELAVRDLYFKNVDSFLLRAETSAIASQQFMDNKHKLLAVCFDMVRLDGDTRIGQERHNEMMSIFSGLKLSDPVIPIPYFGNVYGEDMVSISALMSGVLAKKGEGLMLMDMNSIYIPGRSNSLIKVKKTLEVVGTVVDYEMAEKGTKIEGGVSALICMVPGCTVPVRVGSGLNNEQRRLMAENSPIGKAVEIDAFSYSKDKIGNISLNMPIFKRLLET